MVPFQGLFSVKERLDITLTWEACGGPENPLYMETQMLAYLDIKRCMYACLAKEV